jgi:hypothetical protein
VGRLGRPGQGAPPDRRGGRYIEFCKSTVPHSLSLRGMKIVVDAAHGAAYHVAPDVFHELGAVVVPIGCQPDGLNINQGVGATRRRRWSKAVAEHQADYGIALDGDADRLQMVDAQGRLYNGDELLYVMAADRLASARPVPGVVGTLMTNMAVEVALRRSTSRWCAPRSATATCWKSWPPRLAAGRRRLGPPAGAGPPHHRRRHRQRAADHAGHAPQRQDAGGAAGRRDAVPADADQRAPARRQRLEEERPRWTTRSRPPRANWATAAGC